MVVILGIWVEYLKTKKLSGKSILQVPDTIHEYWTILDHFGIPVFFASGCNQHDFKNVNITISGNTGTPDMFQYSTILGRSSIWDLKYTFSFWSSDITSTVMWTNLSAWMGWRKKSFNAAFVLRNESGTSYFSKVVGKQHRPIANGLL